MDNLLEGFSSYLLPVIVYGFIGYMSISICVYIVIFVVSAIDLRKKYKLNEEDAYEDYLNSADTKPLTVIVPAYNEEAGIIGSVRSLLSMNYPEYEIVIVNDGSKDRTLELVVERFEMKPVSKPIRMKLQTKPVKQLYQSVVYPNVYLIDKENGGKADSLNAGINVSHYPFICSIDGDSVLDRNSFVKVMKPIIESDEQVIATGGSVRVANGSVIQRGEIMKIFLPRSPLVVMQVIEYLRAFLIGRNGLSQFNLLLIISGAFGVFNKQWVLMAGGYRTDTVGEDMELVVRLHRLNIEKKANRKIIYIPDPVCWTEVPESLQILRRQRARWQRGLFESLWTHRSMLFNPKYGLVGMVSMPFYLIFELLGVFVEAIGYLIIPLGFLFSFINTPFAILMTILTILLGSFLSVASVLLEEWSVKRYPLPKDLVSLFFFGLSESFWYRPMTIVWRLQGLWEVLRRSKSWGEMTRKGVSE
ncbi:glycosyltransferase [Radiobacillus kanasensis]|uniref:glycosyltransferase family 2 protein n=1 Tax=Radiobacillus kanasensis TaxID=2844358 RepID=UPI001E3508BE|nr:glycosyltransferase [Radiobacillus kanasensis]UFU00540.1 glycosyltransferase [Radiobacillus kanasensis]